MIAILHQINTFLCHAAFTLVGMILVVIISCVVSSFFLVIVAIGATSAGAYALEAGGLRAAEGTAVLVGGIDCQSFH